jgi:hypothetical protein
MWTSGDNRLHIFCDGVWRDTTCPRVSQTFTGTAPPSNPGIGDKWNDGVSLVEYTTDGTDSFWREA